MINNVSNNTISGSINEIDQGYSSFDITPPQFYSCLFCLTLIIVTAIIMTSKLMQTIILRMNYINPKIIQDIKKQVKKELK